MDLTNERSRAAAVRGIAAVGFGLTALGAGAVAVAQDLALPPVRFPALPATAADAAGFVPPSWAMIASRRGDLNRDGAADLVLLLRMRDRANMLAVPAGDRTERFDTNPHLLVVAFAEPRRGFRLAASSHGLFPRPLRPWTGDEPPGPDTIRLERGHLVVDFSFLRGWSRYRFRWQGGAFRLIGYDSAGASGGCVATTSINFLTGRARMTNAPISSDRSKAVWRRLEGAAPPSLDRIDLETYSPETAIAGQPLPCPPPDDE
jgi:hypothetical protein